MKGYLRSLFLAVLLMVNNSGRAEQTQQAQQAQQAQEISLAFGLESFDFKPLVDLFSQSTGIQVQVVSYKTNELKSQLLQKENPSQLPDAIIVPSDFMGLHLINPSPIPQSMFKSSTSERALKSTLVDGIHRGVPIVYGNHLLLYYNKNIVKEPAANWRDLIEQGSQLEQELELIAWSYLEMYWFVPFLGTFSEFPYKRGQVRLNTKGMVEALRWYKSLSDNGVVDKNCDYECALSKFKSGKLAYTINGVWAYSDYLKALKGDLGVAVLPNLDDKPMRPYFSSHVIAFPNDSLASSKAPLLKDLAHFLQSDQAQILIWNKLKSLPVNKYTLSFIESKGGGDFNTILKQLETAEPMPNEQEMAVVWEAMLKGTTRYIADVYTAPEAASYMQFIAEKSIDYAKTK